MRKAISSDSLAVLSLLAIERSCSQRLSCCSLSPSVIVMVLVAVIVLVSVWWLGEGGRGRGILARVGLTEEVTVGELIDRGGFGCKEVEIRVVDAEAERVGLDDLGGVEKNLHGESPYQACHRPRGCLRHPRGH